MDVAPVPDSGVPHRNTPSHSAAASDDAAEGQFSFLLEDLCGAAGARALDVLKLQPLSSARPAATPAAAPALEGRPVTEPGDGPPPDPHAPGAIAVLRIPVAALQALEFRPADQSDDDGSRDLPAAGTGFEPGPLKWIATKNPGTDRNPLNPQPSNPAPVTGSDSIAIAEAADGGVRTPPREMVFAMRVSERPEPSPGPAGGDTGGLKPATSAVGLMKMQLPAARQGDAVPGRMGETPPGSGAGTGNPAFKGTPEASHGLSSDAPGADRFRPVTDSQAEDGLSNQLRNRDQGPERRGQPTAAQPGTAAAEPSVQLGQGMAGHLTPAPHASPAPGGPIKGADPDRAPVSPHLEAAGPAAVGPDQRRAAEPARDISLRLTAADKSPVEVRLMERAGEVRVAVRSADAELSQAARAGLSQLVERMAERGFDAEVWRPAAVERPVESGPDRHSRDAGASDQRGSDDRRHPGNRQGEQQHQRGSQPKWVDELETSFGPAKLRTGV